MKIKLIKISLLVIVLSMVAIVGTALAQQPTPPVSEGTKLIVPLPGSGLGDTVTNPGQYITSIYRFSLGIGGLLAMLIIVFGGIKWTVSAGNPSAQGEAKSIITNAVVGLVLLLGAFLILNTLDPNLTKLELKRLDAASASGDGISGFAGDAVARMDSLKSELSTSNQAVVSASDSWKKAQQDLNTAKSSGDQLAIAEATVKEAGAHINALKAGRADLDARLNLAQHRFDNYDLLEERGAIRGISKDAYKQEIQQLTDAVVFNQDQVNQVTTELNKAKQELNTAQSSN